MTLCPVPSRLKAINVEIMFSLRVLYEDNHCLAVYKPPGLLTMGFPGAPLTLIDHARNYIKQRYRKPGKVFLGVLHRLDLPVSGVVLFARTSKSASRLSRQFREQKVKKYYWAVVENAFGRDQCVLEDWLIRDSRLKKVIVVPDAIEGSQYATLGVERVQVLEAGSPARQKNQSQSGSGEKIEHANRIKLRKLTLLDLRPATGRKHQLRVQLSSRGFPICGDRKYGSQIFFQGSIALHARRVIFEHPIRREPISVSVELPPKWKAHFAMDSDRINKVQDKF